MRIITQGPEDAYANMAMDEAITEAVRQELSPPTLRIYQWTRPSLSIGYFQKNTDINLQYCREMKLPVVRRLTGGRAILHDRELTYSFSALNSHELFRGNLFETYKIISNALIRCLLSCGIDATISLEKKRSQTHKNPACFKAVSFGEISVAGKKIIGSAQKRFENSFLQHGSMLLGFSPENLNTVLNYEGPESFETVTSLENLAPGVTITELCLSLKEAFQQEFEVQFIEDAPTRFETGLAKDLRKNKYATDEWNCKR
ncbi:MAG: lipoate--protein ligase family protein [Nitrospira sp.]|nr:lipoate--protein ligase family protein [bacterium]MBL7048938.1 lipoate--protein ligase family protein [Nitrospira sp.]